MDREKIAIVILAAGASKRFGSRKLLSQLKGKPLISYVLNEFCIESYGKKILVVNPYFPLDIVKCERFKILINNNYENGLATSLIIAVNEVLSKGYDGFFILLGDMPFLMETDVERLLKVIQKDPNCIIAFRYNGIKGFPTYVPKRYFDRVLSLKGDRGIKQLIAAQEVKVRYLEGSWRHIFDVDTPEDLKEAEKFLENPQRIDETTLG